MRQLVCQENWQAGCGNKTKEPPVWNWLPCTISPGSGKFYLVYGREEPLRRTMAQSKYLILGGGMVAGYMAKELVQRGSKPGKLAVVSADSAPPYERPPLSKRSLAGRDDDAQIWINLKEFYSLD